MKNTIQDSRCPGRGSRRALRTAKRQTVGTLSVGGTPNCANARCIRKKENTFLRVTVFQIISHIHKRHNKFRSVASRCAAYVSRLQYHWYCHFYTQFSKCSLSLNYTRQQSTQHETHQSTETTQLSHHHAVPITLKILTLLLADYFRIFCPLFYLDKIKHLTQQLLFSSKMCYSLVTI